MTRNYTVIQKCLFIYFNDVSTLTIDFFKFKIKTSTTASVSTTQYVIKKKNVDGLSIQNTFNIYTLEYDTQLELLHLSVVFQALHTLKMIRTSRDETSKERRSNDKRFHSGNQEDILLTVFFKPS